MTSPIIVGGNGHSGTRLFAEILLASGVYMGVPGFSYDRKSKDLNVRALTDYWIKSYLLGQNEQQQARMKAQFKRRVRLLIPFQSGLWGFKNPRTMFLLPFYHSLFPNMSFIHVIRDGRDMCFGNPFIKSPTYWGILTEDELKGLTLEERMMRFWGEGNRRVKEYGETNLKSRYLRMRFEDICDNPESEVQKVVEFAGGMPRKDRKMLQLVKKPKSIGRWRTFESGEVKKVALLGARYLDEFGYR
jgi:Sulfotransferase family